MISIQSLQNDCTTVPFEMLIQLIDKMLQSLIFHNDKIRDTNLTRFHSRSMPSFGIKAYLERIVKYGSITKPSLLCILIYVDRVCVRNPSFIISSLTVHRFILASLTTSTKALCDSFLRNQYYAKVGGMSALELSSLEFELLEMLEWNVGVDETIMQKYFDSLLRSCGQTLPIIGRLPNIEIEKVCRSAGFQVGFTASQPNDHHPVPLQS